MAGIVFYGRQASVNVVDDYLSASSQGTFTHGGGCPDYVISIEAPGKDIAYWWGGSRKKLHTR
jgi:hypothetical protein